MNISNEELILVQGGAVKWGVLGAVGGIITFVIGLIDGLFRPLRCN